MKQLFALASLTTWGTGGKECHMGMVPNLQFRREGAHRSWESSLEATGCHEWHSPAFERRFTHYLTWTRCPHP
jgi:hypothetical protein